MSTVADHSCSPSRVLASWNLSVKELEEDITELESMTSWHESLIKNTCGDIALMNRAIQSDPYISNQYNHKLFIRQLEHSLRREFDWCYKIIEQTAFTKQEQFRRLKDINNFIEAVEQCPNQLHAKIPFVFTVDKLNFNIMNYL